MSEIPPAQHCYFDTKDKILRFYDRESELRDLYKFWNFTDVESSIIKIANMPGIGKTELVLQFMRTYGMKEKAMLIYINFVDILPAINKATSMDKAYIITKKVHSLILPQLQWYYNQFGQDIPSELLEIIQDALDNQVAFDIYIDNVCNANMLHDIRKIFFFDELQKLWGIGVESVLTERQIQQVEDWYRTNPGKRITTRNRLYEISKHYEQGIFRDFIYLLKVLIKEGMHISIISGTQYRLLNSMEDIGSPISGRIRRLNFARIPKAKMNDWFADYFPMPATQDLLDVWQELQSVIIEYASGIPRIMVGFLQALPDDYEQFLNNLKRNYNLYFTEYLKHVDDLLTEYVHNRINKFLNDFGEEACTKLLARIARHFLFHDATDEEEVHSWIKSIEWESTPPDAADLVQIGLLLRGNGSLQPDYLNPHSEQLGAHEPLILVSKYVHELLRKRFIDNLWQKEMKITLSEELLHVLNMSPSVVGFAFEYYLAKKLLQLSQDNLILVNAGESRYFDDLTYIDGYEQININLHKLENIVSRQYVDKITMQKNIIYLVSQETAIDGVVMLEDKILVYQAKFRKKAETLTNSFFVHFNDLVTKLNKKYNLPVYKILFTLTRPTAPSIEKLKEYNYLICSDLKSLLGETMLNWLVASKSRSLSL